MRHRLPLLFIFMTLAIDAMGIGVVIPVMPALIREIEGGTIASAAVWGGIFSTVYALMQFLCGPLLGALSDRYGRRPLLLITLTIMSLDYVIVALAGSVWLLLGARVMGGIAASTRSVATAFIADISTPEQKAARFGLVGAAFGLGFVAGPLLGGLLAEFGTRAPFWAAAALALANMLLGLFILPETVTDEIRRPFHWKRANPWSTLLDLGRTERVGRLTFLFFLYQTAFFVYPAIWAYFAVERFDWSPRTIGLSLGLFGISLAIVQGWLIRYVLRWFGDRGTVLWGLLFNAVVFLLLGVLEDGTIALMLTPLAAIGGVVIPALQAMMSRAIPDNAQGGLQGLLTSAGALAMIVSPLVMSQVFWLATAENAPIYLPGLPFLLSMGLMGICVVVFLGRKRMRP
ncbi:MFS transporter, DHA1 family, tetracycline resistance protein [Palleronia marisminoris]|uniref:Tetracycline resistance protein, class C n=1 Tax=Palleronia marisminoris TaxID=315423 RepID=A0A1Y5S2E7_9RHOB|nr:TCR/Tet family MFS transporter [Palleronia marisminoris]SFG37095.1 MFS transporter, DHA1 family, tetracycline resistance protein [Palleronia marisminoris]SLN30074.1 Tetracycline resistance protein, class C [Palleronia marisminoris]